MTARLRYKKTARLVLAAAVAVFIGLWGPAASAQLDELYKAADTLSKAVLHSLDTAQQVYYMDHQTFTDDLSALNSQANFVGHEDVTVTITHADAESWRATAKHRKSPHTIAFDSAKGGFQE